MPATQLNQARLHIMSTASLALHRERKRLSDLYGFCSHLGRDLVDLAEEDR